MSSRDNNSGDAHARAVLHDLRQYVTAGALLADLGTDDVRSLPVEVRLDRMAQIFLMLQQIIDEQLGLLRCPEVIDLEALVVGCVSMLLPGMGTRVVHRTDARLQIRGDPVQLQRAVGNLLDNAQRAAGPFGSIEVAIGQEGPMAYVEVTDDGAGFGRVPSRDGQGMAVVASAVHALHGKMDISSGPDVGTRVRLSFPSCEQSGAA